MSSISQKRTLDRELPCFHAGRKVLSPRVNYSDMHSCAEFDLAQETGMGNWVVDQMAARYRYLVRAMSSLFAMLGAMMAISVSANAAEIRVYSGGAPQVAMKVLAPEFERATGHKLAFTYAVVGEIRKRLAGGERADVILLPAALMDSLGKAEILRPESRRLLARVGIGVIVREGAAQPDISNSDSVRKALVNSRSIVYADPKMTPGGKHLAGIVGKLGIADTVGPKTTWKNAIDGGAALVANGEVDIGMFLVSEVKAMKGVTLVGLLPPELQSYVVYAGAIAADTSTAEPSLAFLNFLSDPANQSHWKAAGFEPLGSNK